jgi:hypothetical protein
VDRRVVTRLALLSGTAAGVLAFAVHLDHAPGTVAATADAPVASTSVTAGGAGTVRTTGTGARRHLERLLTRSGATPAAGGHAVDAVDAVDESRPHTHVLDPQTGGPVSVAPGVLPDAGDLGPMHVDPMPAGVSVSDPIDTGSLLVRAGVAQARRAAPDQPFTAGMTAPVGTPGVASLSSHVVPSCSGTGVDGNRVQVLYVREADTASRLAAVLPILRNEVASVDDVFAVSAQQTGGVRRVRWVHDAACRPVITSVTVPDGGLGTDFNRTITDLKAQGYNKPNRKYLMFADSKAFCGIGTVYQDARLVGNKNDGGYASYSRVDAPCWSGSSSAAAHELTHNLGGVLAGAPHVTAHGHCTDDRDLMCYDDDGAGPVTMRSVCASAQEQLLDCKHDDYFSTAPPAGSYLAQSWNTASSSFLDRVLVDLPAPTVTLAADVTGAETGDPVTFTATSDKAVAWAWSRSSAGAACRLDPVTPGRATLLCPSTVAGPVTVTAKATETGTGMTASKSATVTITPAAAPTATLTVPASAGTGTPVPVSVAPVGKAPFTYAWTAGSCVVADPSAASTTVTCAGGTPSQSLPVGVLVTQADGRTVRVSRDVALAGASSPLPASWTAPVLRSGVLSSVLRSTTAPVLAARPVSLEVRWYGASTWTSLGPVTTDATGRAAVTPRYSRAGTFRFV